VSEIVSTLEPDRTLKIWHISSLRKLSETMPRISVPLNLLKDLDENLWFSTYNEVPTCRAVAKHAKRIMNADLNYPIILAPDGSVLDGMHRAAKAWLEGASEIMAVQLCELPLPDVVIPNYDRNSQAVPG
jgi:hypothetical protein